MTYGMNFLFAVVIGVVIGLAGGFALRERSSRVLWLPPALATAGALLGAVVGAVAGNRGNYGYKESTLQVVLAVVGVAVAYVLATRTPVSR
jgi:hypothetical protein